MADFSRELVFLRWIRSTVGRLLNRFARLVLSFSGTIRVVERSRVRIWWGFATVFGLVLGLLVVGTLAVVPGDPTPLAGFFLAVIVGTLVFVVVAVADT